MKWLPNKLRTLSSSGTAGLLHWHWSKKVLRCKNTVGEDRGGESSLAAPAAFLWRRRIVIILFVVRRHRKGPLSSMSCPGLIRRASCRICRRIWDLFPHCWKDIAIYNGVSYVQVTWCSFPKSLLCEDMTWSRAAKEGRGESESGNIYHDPAKNWQLAADLLNMSPLRGWIPHIARRIILFYLPSLLSFTCVLGTSICLM